MRNRFGHSITRGMHVLVSHPRGGSYRAEVARIYRAPAYGWHAAFVGAGSAPIDDCEPDDLQTVVDHFLIAAVWADCPEGTNPRPCAESRAQAWRIVSEFVDANPLSYRAAMARESEGYGSHPDAGSAQAAFGHDLYLTLAGHGCGFWDRSELGRLGERLTQACRRSKFRYPSALFYRGWLYFYGVRA